MYFIYIFVLLALTITNSQILKYQFSHQECVNLLFVEQLGSGLNFVVDSFGTSCSQTYLLNVGTFDGVQVDDCSVLNRIYSNLNGNTVFNQFSTNYNISIEVWFSFSSPIVAGTPVTYGFLEISNHTKYPSQELNVSASSNDPNLGFQYIYDYNINVNGFYQLFSFEIGAYFNPSGSCNVQAVNSELIADSSSNFNSLYQSIGTANNVLYKLAMTLSDNGYTYIYIQSSVDLNSVEYGYTFQKSSLFNSNLLKLIVNSNQIMRIGCAVEQFTLPKANIRMHKLAIYNQALSLNDAINIFKVN